jgi:hypothetical protein
MAAKRFIWHAMRRPGSAREAGLQRKVAALIIALHAILAYAQFTSMVQNDDSSIFLGLLAIELASAGGIFLGSCLFACMAMACCLGEVAWILDSDNVQQFVRLFSINAIGWLGALGGARGSVACYRFRDVLQSPQRIHFGMAIVLWLIGVFWIVWSFPSYFSMHD